MDEPRELALIILMLDTGITLQEITDLDDREMNIHRTPSQGIPPENEEREDSFLLPGDGSRLCGLPGGAAASGRRRPFLP